MSARVCAAASNELLPVELYAAGQPDAVALAAPGCAPLSYERLRQHLEASSVDLLDAGIRRGGVVALALPSGPEFVTAFLAASSIGACAPLAPSLTESESSACLTRLGAQAVVGEEGSAASAARSLGIQVVTVRRRSGDPAGVFALLPGVRSTAAGRSLDAALLLHTSATTGTPKVVPLTLANLRAMALHDARALELTAADRFLALMPLYHLHGISAVLTQLSCGGGVFLPGAFDAERFPSWLADFRPTWFSSSPTIHHAILALAREHPDAFRSAPLRLIRSTGAGLDPELLASLEEATGVPVLEGYGLSETGGVARSTLSARRPGSVGRSSGLEIAILDASGAALPPMAEGEIAVRGPSVACGYLENPEATAASFRDGWFHTGDLGHLDADGFLYLSGRLKQMINRGGEKIIPEEVERALTAHAAVADAAAFAIPHRTLGEDVAAAVVLRAGAAATEAELQSFAVSRLAPFKVPRRIVIADRIPRSSTGKILRALLAEQFGEAATRRDPANAPLDAVSQELIAIWRRVLGVEDIDPEDDFFLLGGDSLSAATMLAEVCRSFGTSPDSLPALGFFEQPTIASLSRLIEVARSGSGSGCIAFRAEGTRVPLFFVPANYGGPYYLRHLARELGNDQPFYAVCPARHVNVSSIEEAARFAVDAIRSIRPLGPYLLAGHCFGGVVAFEAARQLEHEGERVSLLALFDTPAPGYPKIRRQWRRYAAQARNAFSARARGQIVAHIRMLGRILGRRFLGLGARAIPNRLLAGADQDRLNVLAARGYTPRPLSAPIVQFLAGDAATSTVVLDDARLGWRDFAPGGFEARTAAGDHNSLFESSRSTALASQLQTFLTNSK